MKRIKVRFNLSRGKNYLKWKIEYPSGEVEYHSPTDTQLIMKTCQLKNNRNIADKIFHGEHKTVCAWILCEDIEVRFDKFVAYDNNPSNLRLRYNPKITPNWVLNKMTNSDGFKFNEIGTVDYRLYVTIS